MADLPTADEFFRDAGSFPPKYDYSPKALSALEKEFQLPSGILESQMQVESGGKASAQNPKSGAIGPFQVKPDTAKNPGYGLKPGDPRDPRFSASYLRKMIDLAGGDTKKGLAMYNAGPAGHLDNPETNAYVPKIMGKVNLPTADEFFSSPKPEESKPSLVDRMKPSGIMDRIKDAAIGTAGNLAAVIDMGLSLPGMVLGVGADIGTRVYGAATGAPRKETAQKAQQVSSEFAEPFSNPIQKLMALAGHKEGYSQSDVSRVLDQASSWIAKGGDWVEKATHGALLKEDVQSLANEVMVLGGVKGTDMATRAAIEKIGKGKTAPLPKDTPTIRMDPEDKPAAPTPHDTPASLAKQHIEETMRIRKPEDQAKFIREQRADARAAFEEDPQYADYLRNYAEEEARQRDVASLRADELEKGTVVDTQLLKKPLPEVTWNEALSVLKKPGFQRSPEDLVKLRIFNKQGGKADPALLVHMAAIGVGAAAGVWLDPQHPIQGLLLGAAAPGIIRATPRSLKTVGLAASEAIRNGFSADSRINISAMADTYDGRIATSARSIWQDQNKIMELVPDKARREAITHWVQGDKSIPLTDKEFEAAKGVKDFFAKMGKEGQDADVLHGLLDDYVTNLWDLEGKNKGLWEKILKSPSMSSKSRFDQHRTISSLADGKKMGLVPVTEDVAQIMGIYGNSLTRTMANKQLVESLKGAEIAGTSNRLMMSAKDAPKNYVSINHPNLMSLKVHPDIASSVKFLFDQKSASGVKAGIEAVNTGVKRMNVSLSLFHAKSLVESYLIGTGGNPLKIPRMTTGTSPYLKMLKEGPAGDKVDLMLKGGLKVNLARGPLSVEDVGGNFYKALDDLQGVADSIIPGTGLLVKGFEQLHHAADTLTFERLQTGMKLDVAMAKYEALKANNFKAHGANPTKIPLKTDLELAKIASSFTNDLFGGLNWRMVAEQSRTVWGKDLSMEVMSPSGRRNLQLAMFAPDWTLATTRSITQAFRKGTGFKGLIKPQELADLHRQYILRNALFYFTVANGLNYAFSGKFIWQNEDPFMLELGDGRRMNISKHAMEVPRMLEHPVQEVANKLAFFPSEFIEQVTGKEYISATGKAPTMDTTASGRIKHAASRFLPFAGQQYSKSGTASSIAGSLGFPIYGQTASEKQKAKEERAARRNLLEAIRERERKRAEKARKKRLQR